MLKFSLVPVLVLAAVGVLVPARADAHFRLNTPMSWMSQSTQGSPQKNGPCAATLNTTLEPATTPVTPTGIVNAFQPGQTVSVSVTATVPHPGWYRIALVQGPASSQTLTTFPDPKAMAGTNCTPPIMANPVWSTTQPVLADGLPAGSTANTQQSGTQTFQVTIPQSAVCTSARPCALQVIMVMTDHPADDCYYHHCADISVGSTPDAGAGTGTAGTSGSKDAGGTGTGTGSGGSSGGTGSAGSSGG